MLEMSEKATTKLSDYVKERNLSGALRVVLAPG
jgi:hypothetical protein